MGALGVVPVDPSEGRELEVLDGLPLAGASRPADGFGLVVAVHRLGQGVVVAVADGPDRRRRADLGESLAVADRRELATGIAMAPQILMMASSDQRAISIAWRTISVRIWDAQRQPTIILLNTSMMKQT